MIKKICDKCSVIDHEVRTYTFSKSCLSEKIESNSWQYMHTGDGVKLPVIPPTREYCRECFTEIDNKVRAVIEEALSL